MNVDEDGEDLDTMVNYAQAIRMFANKYVSYYSALVRENAGGSLNPRQFVEQLFALIHTMNLNTQAIFKDNFEELEENDEMNEEEKQSEYEFLYDYHSSACNAISKCVSAVSQLLDGKLVDEQLSAYVIDCATNLVVECLSYGTVSTPGINTTIEAFEIMKDIFEDQNISSDIKIQLYTKWNAGAISVQIMEDFHEEYELLGQVYLVNKCFLACAPSTDIATNA